MVDTSRDHNSRKLMEEAREVLVGGVNSPVRAFASVGGAPRFFVRGEGPRIWDADGNEFIDLVGSWGPLILGHAPPRVCRAVAQALGRGTSFGAPCALEVELARRVVDRVPSVERVRFVNSGTEATMSAVRLARGATGRHRIIKMEGHYHGHGDSFLVAAGSGALTLGVPDSPGVPPGVASDTLLVPFNDAAAVERLFDMHPGEIACVILEPVAGNMGVVPPRAGYIERLRSITQENGALLIFDEVMTGFRVAAGGWQERSGVVPDLTTMGKVIGGGLPVGAYGGAAEWMDQVAPEGPIYQAGTLSGNPLAMAAGVATLDALADPGVYEELERRGAHLEAGLLACPGDSPMHVQRVGSMLTLFFHDGPVENLADAQQADHARFGSYHRGMLHRGIYLPPSGYEAWFLSTAHTEADVECILAAHRESVAALG